MADEERGTLYGHSIPDGPVVRPPADPERDARIKAYRARERAKVVAAFDRFLERMFNDPYGERPEWADPPVWLRTEAEVRACGDLYGSDSRYVCGQRSGHDGPHEYDDTAPTGPVCNRTGEPGHLHVWQAGRCVAPTETVGIHQKAHYGVTDASAVHVPHLHDYDAAPCFKIECHELGNEYCTWCGGQPCRVVLAPRNPDYAPGVTIRDESGAVSHECPPDGQTCSYPLHDPEPCSMAYWYDFGRWEWAPAYLVIEAGVPARMCKFSGPHAFHLPGDTFIGPDDEDPRASQG